MEAFLAVLSGLPMTILLTVCAFAIGVVGAVPVALALRSRFLLLRLVSRLAVDLVRGVPVIVWLFILKFGVSVGTFRFDPVVAAIVGLGIVSIAYLAEIFRGGIQSVPRGQIEAASALGLHHRVTFARVIAPQAFRIVSPSIATYLMGLLKDSSIASTIIVLEMVFMAQSFARQNPTAIGVVPYLVAGLLYIALSFPIAYASRRLDARLRKVSR